jgi:hypothetical protein
MKYYKNNSLIVSQNYINSNNTLYYFGTIGQNIYPLVLGPIKYSGSLEYTTTTSINFTVVSNYNIVSDLKSESFASSKESYSQGCYMSFTAPNVNSFSKILGLCLNPNSVPLKSVINWGLKFQNSDVYVANSGVFTLLTGYAYGDIMQINYNGNEVTYWKNRILFYTQNLNTLDVIYLGVYSEFNLLTAQYLENIHFGPQGRIGSIGAQGAQGVQGSYRTNRCQWRRINKFDYRKFISSCEFNRS